MAPELFDHARASAGLTRLVLIAATLVSWLIGADHGTGSVVGALVLGIAAIKVRLVGLDFMELRHAPVPLRAAFEAYCVGMWSLLSALYSWL